MFSEQTVFRRTITLDRDNTDPAYLRRSIYDKFPELRSAAFRLCLRHKGWADMEEIPDYVDNVSALCSQYKNVVKSAVYIRPKVRITSLPQRHDCCTQGRFWH